MWKPMDTAPKDRPILVMCNEECNDVHCVYSKVYIGSPAKSRRVLCLYHAHAEGLSAYGTGPAIVEWGGAFDDSTWEYPNQASLPDWWFVYNSGFEVAANPIAWCDVNIGDGKYDYDN